MDLENQARIKAIAEEFGGGELVVLLGSSEAESASIAAETVTLGDPAYAGALTEVPLGLLVYHIMEPEIKTEIEPSVYDEQLSMMEMVLDVDSIAEEVAKMRAEGSKY